MSSHDATPRCSARQLKLLRRTAPRCLVSSLLAIEREIAAMESSEISSDVQPRSVGESLTRAGSPILSRDYVSTNVKAEANFLKKMKNRLDRLTHAFVASTEANRERAGFLLAAHLALIFVPAACCFGSWPLAALEATAFLNLISRSETDSARSIARLTQLAAPVIWALIFAHPAVQGDEP